MMMKKTLFILSALVFLFGCKEEKTFCIEGNISGADSSMLYLEHLTLGEGNVVIDSIRLTADGAFRFEEEGVASPASRKKASRVRSSTASVLVPKASTLPSTARRQSESQPT